MIVRNTFILSIFLVFISIWKLFLIFPGNAEKFTHWFILVLKTTMVIFLLVSSSQAKKVIKGYKKPA